jgi:hypothetical protein
MRFSVASLVLTVAATAMANKETVSEDWQQVCSGMYDKQAFGGSVNPFIGTNLVKFEGGNTDVSVVIFEFQDLYLFGKEMDDGNRKWVCDEHAVSLNLCDESSLGQFIVDDDMQGNKSEVLTYQLTNLGSQEQTYLVKNTGYYCVATFALNSNAKYSILVNFRNSFGQLAASEFPKLPLYAVLAVAYAVCFAYYAFNFWKHKHEVLPLQKYIMAFYLFLTLECVMIWGLYDLTNRKSSADAGVKVYVVFVSIMNGMKFTFSFFLLLVISLGYGIVYPKLDRKLMLKCRILAGIHLAFAILYIITNYFVKPGVEESAFYGLFALPVVITTGVFYVVTLKSLSATTALLESQKQNIKLQMYQKLFRIIFVSMLVLILGVIVSSFIFIGMSTTELIEQHWKTRFFFLDFWPTLVYFVIFNLIAFIWRPTDTSYMLAASSQLPTDPENAADFELDDLQSLQETSNDYRNLGDNDSLNLGSEDEDESVRDPFGDPPQPTKKKD